MQITKTCEDEHVVTYLRSHQNRVTDSIQSLND